MKRNSNLRIQTFHPKKCRCIQPNFFSHHLNLFPMPDFMGSHKMTWRIFMSKSTKLSVQIIRAEDNTDNVWGNWKWSKEISTSISESFTMRHIIHLDTRLDNISIIIFNLALTWVWLDLWDMKLYLEPPDGSWIGCSSMFFPLKIFGNGYDIFTVTLSLWFASQLLFFLPELFIDS